MDFVSQRMCARGTALTLVFPFKARFISGFSTAFYVNIEIADFTRPQDCNKLLYLCTTFSYAYYKYDKLHFIQYKEIAQHLQKVVKRCLEGSNYFTTNLVKINKILMDLVKRATLGFYYKYLLYLPRLRDDITILEIVFFKTPTP